MKLIDLSKLLAGKSGWVCLSKDNKKIIAEAKTLKELIKKLKNLKGLKGKKNKKKDNFTRWRSISALSKLHNIAVHIRTSNILSNYWRQLSLKLMLGINNATRWNSWYLLIKRAVSMQSKIMEIC